MKFSHRAVSLKAEVTGEVDDDTSLVFFRGIPYATVDKRWTHSQIKHSLNDPFDATQFGPRCVQGEGQVLVSGGFNDPVPGDDEFGCLNLNITVPKEILSLQKEYGSLPVMVWIHGGAFNYGANSVARYRPSKICSMDLESGTPIVLVQIGYRLGPLGFAASNDLASESNSTESKQIEGHDQSYQSGNYGFVDQRNALEWVRDHIHDFGGDPNNVTAFGVSAGSASVHYHILSGSPLFDRAIMMSGSAPTIGPLPFEWYDRHWKSLCSKCDIKGSTPADRLQELRSLKPQTIIENYTTAAMGPMADGKLLPKSWQPERPQVSTRCKSIILGDTGVEAIILDGLFRSIPQPEMKILIESAFSKKDAEDFRTNFGFNLDNSSWEQYRDAMRHFFSVMMFQYPNLRIAESSSHSSEQYLYHFEEPSPYPGPTFGLPYHGQCALYLYNNETDGYPSSGRDIAQQMAHTFTAFAHGKQPWEPYAANQRFQRFGPQGKSTLEDIKSDKTRDYAYLPWLREHFGECKALAQRILQDEK